LAQGQIRRFALASQVVVAMRSLKLFWCLFSVAQAACSDTTTAQDVLADRDLTGQVHVITGGDSGIGFAAAKALAAKNATVVLGCRGTTGKYAEAVANISKATGNSKVSVLVLDLSSFSSVRNFAVQLIKQFPRIDALQCNAGISQNPDFLPPHTEDGFERTFQVNYLGHLLLVEQVFPLLNHSSGRVVITASAASFDPCVWGGYPSNCTALSELPADAVHGTFDTNFSTDMPASNYALTKYLQVFMAAELARRQTDVPVYSLHPGFVESSMTASLPESTLNAWCQGNLTNCPLTADEGAATQVYLATVSSEANGAYYEHCSPATSVRDLMVASVGEPETIKYQQQVFDLASSWTLPICPSWVGHQSGSGLCALSAEGACYVPGTDTASGLAAWKETHTELPTQCVNTTIFPEYQCPYPGVDVKCKFPMLPTCPSWVGQVSGSGLCAPSHAGACYVPSTESASGLAEWKATHTELPTQCLVSSALLDYMCPYPGTDVKCEFRETLTV